MPKIKALLPLVLLTLLLRLAIAEEPSVIHYQTIKENLNEGVISSELILKVNNPTDRTFYVYGVDMTDIPYHIEVLKKGKWSVLPSRRCSYGMGTRPMLPHSYIIFTADESPLNTGYTDNILFRIRVFLYTQPDIRSLYTEPNSKPWIELVSPTFNSNDFRQKIFLDAKLPGLPGVDPVAIPGLDPIPK